MTFQDIFRKSFLSTYDTSATSTSQIAAALLITALLGLYIFACYRILTRRTFYSKSFNTSLVALAVITAAIILTIQSSIVISLGMVGALSIVRFRTAIKDPMDLVFLFWSISVGIICGAGLAEIAVLASLAVTVLLFILDRLPVARAPMILVINGSLREGLDQEIEKIVRSLSSSHHIKTRSITDGQLSLVTELRIPEENGQKLTEQISSLTGITSVSLLSHDGEVTF
ncbi:MAG: DUF4956 domain-containing protein [Lachnospiraceae bacterium]|nr:DUF4956 domain-containing protein [Lachnospiraceae bacterium]